MTKKEIDDIIEYIKINNVIFRKKMYSSGTVDFNIKFQKDKKTTTWIIFYILHGYTYTVSFEINPNTENWQQVVDEAYKTLRGLTIKNLITKEITWHT